MTETPSGLPFDSIRDLCRKVPGPDVSAERITRDREGQLLKPAGALGRLEDIVAWLARWQGKAPPSVERPFVAIFAGNHGVAARGVSAFPADVTAQMVGSFQAGWAAINQLCKANDLGLQVFDLALDIPTGDITVEPALSERDCAATIAFGMEALASGSDLLCVGEMGIGNTTIAAALAAALHGGQGTDWVGRGTGVDDHGLKAKADAVDAALATHAGHLSDPLEILRRLGGREFAAITGAILAARHQRVPVVLDGFPTTAAAAVLHAIDADLTGHCIAGHVSAEPGHSRLLEAMGLVPLLDLGMRLGEGSGAAVAASIIRAAARSHAGMATFAEAGVSGKDG